MGAQPEGEPGRDRPPIFRAEAVEHHRLGREREVLPPAVRPATFRLLWGALAALGVLAAVATAVRVPAYGYGTGVAVPGAAAGVAGLPVALVVTAPAADAAALADGAPVVLADGAVRGTVVRHEPAAVAAAELPARFGVPAAALAGLPDTVAVAVVRLEVGAADVGSSYPVRLRVGSRPVLAGVPLLGGLVR